MRPIQSWTDLEDAVQADLKRMQERGPVFAHRFYDSRSAGALLPAQPGDFFVLADGLSVFMECKFSEVHTSLVSCFSKAVQGHQLASAHLAARAGGKYGIVFFSAITEVFEVWDGDYCYTRRSLGKKLEIAKARKYEDLKTLLGCELRHQAITGR